MNTKVVKKSHLDTELLDWNFYPEIYGLEIIYNKDGKEKELALSGDNLLSALDKAFIIDGYKDGMVKVSGVLDGCDYQGEHTQTAFGFDLSLSEFMQNDFTAEDAYRLINNYEESKQIKRYAKHIANQVQNTVKSFS